MKKIFVFFVLLVVFLAVAVTGIFINYNLWMAPPSTPGIAFIMLSYVINFLILALVFSFIFYGVLTAVSCILSWLVKNKSEKNKIISACLVVFFFRDDLVGVIYSFFYFSSDLVKIASDMANVVKIEDGNTRWIDFSLDYGVSYLVEGFSNVMRSVNGSFMNQFSSIALSSISIIPFVYYVIYLIVDELSSHNVIHGRFSFDAFLNLPSRTRQIFLLSLIFLVGLYFCFGAIFATSWIHPDKTVLKEYSDLKLSEAADKIVNEGGNYIKKLSIDSEQVKKDIEAFSRLFKDNDSVGVFEEKEKGGGPNKNQFGSSKAIWDVSIGNMRNNVEVFGGSWNDASTNFNSLKEQVVHKLMQEKSNAIEEYRSQEIRYRTEIELSNYYLSHIQALSSYTENLVGWFNSCQIAINKSSLNFRRFYLSSVTEVEYNRKIAQSIVGSEFVWTKLVRDSDYSAILSELDVCKISYQESLIAFRSKIQEGQSLGFIYQVYSWLLQTQSFDLCLITGMWGFGLLGASIAFFVRRDLQVLDEEELLIPNLFKVILGGLSAALIVYLTARGGLALISTSNNQEPNAYVLFFSCFVGAVFSEDVWKWAQIKFGSSIQA
ncbi:hypothetical protein [Methylomonas sp. UP202]|uniref:hypothetical protein n=1 Tax=Methylomonas sp. UP202 TaxID=3040943 RepID=UPI0024789B3D|nr:hypothetical protein [Methylomonas sp. UP202]WGS84648.1 hypothetical protein QC632_16495 [Methylomonas sp. UP202]